MTWYDDMQMLVEPAASQLADEIGIIAIQLATLTGVTLGEVTFRRIERRTPTLIHRLLSPDPRLSKVTAVEIMTLIWPSGVNRLAWWRTPLGAVVAYNMALTDKGGVEATVAGEILGLHRKKIGRMAENGELARHTGGGITLASIYTRLAHQAIEDLT